MQKTVLGRMNCSVSRVGFGALPIQRIDKDAAKRILCQAVESGINFFDTARGYSDSEEKMGYALASVRDRILIATKTHASDAKGFWENLETSRRNLKTELIDLYQFHNPSDLSTDAFKRCYEAACTAKARGLIRHIGITNHSLKTAREAVCSGMFDTLQYPFSTVSSDEDEKLVELCKQKNVGFIAMKALAGGLITDVRTAFAYLWQYDHVVPIWGIQKIEELQEIVGYEQSPPVWDKSAQQKAVQDRRQLQGSFCRGCGYCLPCPADIDIPMAARMKFLLRRAPIKGFVSETRQKQMERIEQCTKCGACIERCPYHLNTPELLVEMLADYRDFIQSMEKSR